MAPSRPSWTRLPPFIMTSNNESKPEAGASGETPRRPRYTLRPVVKPLPSQKDAANADKPLGMGPRAENEDDDGYDPYSDYHDGTARVLEFEDDPWR